MRVYASVLMLVLVLSHAEGVAATVLQVIYPAPESASDHRYDFHWTLLRTVLDKTIKDYGPYEMRTNPQIMNIPRSGVELESPPYAISILALATSIEREQHLLPIRIPIDKGLLGYRVFLIRHGMQANLDRVKTLDDLKAFSIGQGTGWADVPILKSAGLQVVEAPRYDALVPMLMEGRFDLFSRGVLEAEQEYATMKSSTHDLEIESSLLLVYPLPRYFFFARTEQGRALATRVEVGLKRAMADGSFERLFDEYKKPFEQNLGLKKRRLIRIPNPTLPGETPLNRPEYWYDPFQGKAAVH